MPGNGKVFISHAHDDNTSCQPLLRALDAWGVDYWFDTQRLDAGDDLSLRIQRAIAERDIFLRICTAAAQRSYWVRLETGAARGLQAEAHSHGDDGQRVLINLILDTSYAREPFDYATVFIDAATVPDAIWQEELRRTLGAHTHQSSPLAPAPASLVPPADVPPGQSHPAAAIAPGAATSVTGEHATPVEVPPTPHSTEIPQEPEASQPSRAPAAPRRHALHVTPRSVSLVALAALLIVASFSGLLMASAHGWLPGSQARRGSTTPPHATAPSTPSATATPRATATPSPPSGFAWVSDSSASYAYLASSAWNISPPLQNTNKWNGTVYNLRVAPSASASAPAPAILTARITKPPASDDDLLTYLAGTDGSLYGAATFMKTIAGVRWLGVDVRVTPPDGHVYDTITYACHHGSDGFEIQLQERDDLQAQYQSFFDRALQSFRFLA
ncbi:MAG: TIR domain-containing protein [Ktedonobacterales bacterium]